MTPHAQSMLDVAGPKAAAIERLFWANVVIAGVVYVLVALALAIALWRRPAVDNEAARRRKTRAVAAAVGATAVVLLGLLVASILTGRAVRSSGIGEAAFTIDVTGHRFWWQIVYTAPIPRDRITDANEIHIPVGRPVQLRLRSADVIHSLWIPALVGKRDLIPGLTSELTLVADRPGRYRAQCAEFCGYQHAKMALWVVAHPTDEFEAWLRAARRPATPARDPLARRGQEIFERGPCAMCHAITGLDAHGSAGPDLTRLASRMTLAAGTLPNVRGYLAGWILDPQSHKPGANMPAIALSGPDLQALLAFLEGLE
jgi:cytochrome c oxidase subunit 2